MAKSLVMSLIAAAGMAAALLVGCGDNDAKPTPSKAGQSCARTADCADGLSCIANVCYASSSGGSGGQAGTASAPGPVLGGIGESCTSRLDCSTGLACFNQRCTNATSAGEGGAPSMPSAQLGDRGETCRVNADCSTGLICVPGYITSGIGQCDLAKYDYPAPSGMSCVGECKTAADCCELPPAAHTATINSCSDLVALIGGEDCSSSTISPTVAQYCFMQSVYCDCAKNTWSCDANSRCQYTAKCTVTGATTGGCPSYTRGNFTVPACDTKAQKCQTAASAACTKDTDCDEGVYTADTELLCSKGECTCYSGGCYNKCAQDIDCAPGRVCDAKKTKLCVPQTGCTTDLDCAVGNRVGDKCVDGACKRPCTNDHDCSGSGLVTGAPFNGTVCSAAGYCESIQGECTDDAQCKTALPGSTNLATGVKAFCVKTPTATTTSVMSAITD